MRKVQESIEIGAPAGQVSELWPRFGRHDDEAAVEGLGGGRSRLTVKRTIIGEGLAEHLVNLAFHNEGANLRAELEHFRLQCELSAATGAGVARSAMAAELGGTAAAPAGGRPDEGQRRAEGDTPGDEDERA